VRGRGRFPQCLRWCSRKQRPSPQPSPRERGEERFAASFAGITVGVVTQGIFPFHKTTKGQRDDEQRQQTPFASADPQPRAERADHQDARDPDTKFTAIEQLRPPKGAPNVLLILIDDAGFGSNSAFGGPCQTPNMEKLAAGGLKYNRFHTTALCSPTRAALLSGRNHQSCSMGGITEIATGAPGYSSVLPDIISPLGCDVGEDSGAPVSQDYGSRGNAFTGTVKGVQLAIGEAAESSDQLVSPEEAVRIAMARQ
jgi:Sulfatase